MSQFVKTSSASKFRFAIDRGIFWHFTQSLLEFALGGTFTDVYCDIIRENGVVISRVLKLLSEDPSNYKDAPTEGIRRTLEAELNPSGGIPRNTPIPTDAIESIRMGTTVATNALLERKGERVALITTRGCKDLQFIGNQSRPKIFDLKIQRPDLLYERVVEINERVLVLKELNIPSDDSQLDKNRIVHGLSQEHLYIEQPISEEEVKRELISIRESGITSIAVCLLHSYTYNKHEKLIESIAKSLGFTQISLSCDIMPMIRIVPRGSTTCVDAYLTPVLKKYLHSFALGFDGNLIKLNKVSFMQSDGGLTSINRFSGNRGIPIF